MSTTTRSIAAGSTARKVVGSLGILGTAAAVAGLGTFGGFTDSTTPVNTTVTTGTLSINLTGPAVSVPVNVTGFVPGDSITRPVTLVNDGSLPLGSVHFNSSATTASILTTDVVNGLKLELKSCSVPWTAGAGNTYTCSGTVASLLNGPSVTSVDLANPASLAVGGTDHLAFTVTLPTTADNAFQGKSAALAMTFTATQATGTAK